MAYVIIVVDIMALIWLKRVVPATAGARFVVSDKGEQLPGDLPRGRFSLRLGPEGRLQAGREAGQGPGIPGGGEGR